MTHAHGDARRTRGSLGGGAVRQGTCRASSGTTVDRAHARRCSVRERAKPQIVMAGSGQR